MCRRCGRQSYHKQKNRCSSCGYPDAKMRTPGSLKAKRRRGIGTGRMKYMKRAVRAIRRGRARML